MTHYWAFVVFLAVLAAMAASADADDRRRNRYAALDEAPDLCRGAQPDNTENLQGYAPVRTPRQPKAPTTHSAKKTVGATNQNHHQMGIRS